MAGTAETAQAVPARRFGRFEQNPASAGFFFGRG
jgi:hypothetical protein